jgi:hypothetical protein
MNLGVSLNKEVVYGSQKSKEKKKGNTPLPR